jgi:hypothetical protein
MNDVDKMNKVVEHIEVDVDVVAELIEHIKAHIRKARHLYESGSQQELAEIGNHLLQIDSKIHELFHHIKEKETNYDPHADMTVKKED